MEFIACTGEGCPIKDTCKRFTLEENSLPYFSELPGNWNHSTVDPDGIPIKIFRCDMYWGGESKMRL